MQPAATDQDQSGSDVFNYSDGAVRFGNTHLTGTITADNAQAGNTMAGTLNISHTQGSSSYSQGALVVAGGVGIGQNLNVYKNANITEMLINPM